MKTRTTLSIVKEYLSNPNMDYTEEWIKVSDLI